MCHILPLIFSHIDLLHVVIDRLCLRMPHTSSHLLTYRPPPCSNGPDLSSCATHFDLMRHVFRRFVFFHVISDFVQPSLIGPPPSSLSLHLHVYHLLGGILPFFSFPALACLTSSWWCPPRLLFPCTYMLNIFLVASSPSSLSPHLLV